MKVWEAIFISWWNYFCKFDFNRFSTCRETKKDGRTERYTIETNHQLQLELLSIKSDDIEAIHHERSFLKTRFDIDVSTFGDNSRLNVTTQQFNQLDKEHSKVLKLANEQIIELKNNDDQRSQAMSKSFKSSLNGYKSNPSKIQIAQEASRLEATIKLADIESQKKAELRKSEDDFERLELTKSYEIKQAQLDAMLKVENEDMQFCQKKLLIFQIERISWNTGQVCGRITCQDKHPLTITRPSSDHKPRTLCDKTFTLMMDGNLSKQLKKPISSSQRQGPCARG